MDQSVWFVETQYGNNWRWWTVGEALSTRAEARLARNTWKRVNPGRPFRVKQYKRVEE